MSELTSYNSERIYWAVEQVEREAGDYIGDGATEKDIMEKP